MSEAAKCAKLVRAELKEKFPNIKFSVQSKTYSMGDNVDISYTDGVPCDQVDKVVRKYQYGEFNGMEDMYEQTNCRDDISQTKYLFVNRTLSPEKREEIKKELVGKWGINNPEDEQEWYQKRGMWSDQAIYKESQVKSY